MEGNISMHALGIKQRKREVSCALHLADLLDRYAKDEDGFRARIAKEADELVNVSFGGCMLYSIAEIYSTRAAEFAGYRETFLGVGGHLASLRAKKLSLENHTAAAGAGLRAAGAAYQTFKKVKALSDKQSNDDELNSKSARDPALGLSHKQMQATADSLPVFLEAMWHFSVVDIERTLVAVTHKVCKDHSVDEITRRKRVEGLSVLGQVFMEYALTAGGSKNPKTKVAEMVDLLTGHIRPSDADGSTGKRKQTAEDEAGEVGSSHFASALSESELRELSVRELKKLLVDLGGSDMLGSCVEKEDLVRACLKVSR